MYKYHDIESDTIVTLDELKQEYQLLVNNGTIEDQTFDEYLNNCLTRNNGTLEIIYN